MRGGKLYKALAPNPQRVPPARRGAWRGAMPWMAGAEARPSGEGRSEVMCRVRDTGRDGFPLTTAVLFVSA